jgi:AcrR family transcriptional regulator
VATSSAATLRTTGSSATFGKPGNDDPSASAMAKVRADAHRNRERLLAAATAAFTAAEGTAVSLEAIARGAGVGTLYRHFATREELVEAVYQAELAEVAASAGQLLERHPPLVALRRRMDRYATFVAAKRGMAKSLRAMFAAGTVEPGDTRASVIGAVETLLRAGASDGTVRSDVRAEDVVTSLIGIFLASGSTEQAHLMLDLLLDGLVTTR